MSREIVTINIGGCGVNLAQSLIEQYCAEQGISCLGDKEHKTEYDNSISISFKETGNGKHITRSLLIDTDPCSINKVKNVCKFNKLFDANNLISGSYDACNNFAMGYKSKGNELIDKINNRIRIAMEECDQIQGLIINHSLSGGTGSGLGALILEETRCHKIGFEIFPNDLYHKLRHPAAIYNVLLALHSLIDHIDTSFILDNSKIYKMCKEIFKMETPRYQNYNYLLNKLISSITAPSRYRLNSTLNSITNTLVAFPRLHFIQSSMSNIMPNNQYSINRLKDDVSSLTKQCLNENNCFISMPDFDVEEDKYMAISFSYRGDKIKQEMLETHKSIEWLRRNKKYWMCRWAEDVPTIKFIDGKIPKLPLDDIIDSNKQVMMTANNISISRLFEERIVKVYDILYSKKTYFHCFQEEGMEEYEFNEAREDVGCLEKDYLDIISEKLSDDEQDND